MIITKAKRAYWKRRACLDRVSALEWIHVRNGFAVRRKSTAARRRRISRHLHDAARHQSLFIAIANDEDKRAILEAEEIKRRR